MSFNRLNGLFDLVWMVSNSLNRLFGLVWFGLDGSQYPKCLVLMASNIINGVFDLDLLGFVWMASNSLNGWVGLVWFDLVW